jgi:L-alanine-DL-glutamate epimerase-like enolase superfamily enzyme
MTNLLAHDYPEIKILKIENILLSRMHEKEGAWGTHSIRAIKADAQLVKITTESGLVGIAEICPYGGPTKIANWIDWFSRAMIGKTLADSWRMARPRGGGGAHDSAVAGLDCAFWDILGQAAGKSVAVLLGASPDITHVDAYASGGVTYYWDKNPDQLIDEVLGYQKMNYTTSKIRMGTTWNFSGISAEKFLMHMKKLRDAVGNDFRLAVDGNGRLSREDALIVAAGLDKLGFIWFEDAINLFDIDGFVALQKVAPNLIISGGEAMQSLDRYMPYLEQGALQMLHPDAGWMGLTEMKVIMEMAATYGVSCDPHGWHNGALAIAHAHIMAGAPLYGQVEINFSQGPLRDAILADGLDVKAGKLAVPQVPGLGINLAENLEQKFPYLDHNYHAEIMHTNKNIKPIAREYL